MSMAEGSIVFNYQGEVYQTLSAASITAHVLNLAHDGPSKPGLVVLVEVPV